MSGLCIQGADLRQPTTPCLRGYVEISWFSRNVRDSSFFNNTQRYLSRNRWEGERERIRGSEKKEIKNPIQ